MAPNEIILVVSIALGIVINIFFCITLSNTLKLIKPGNQEIEPVYVWLLVVPIVSLIAIFVIVFRLSNSIANELQDRNFEVPERPGYNLGMGFAVLGILVMIPMPQMLFFLFGIAELILFIQYWSKINWYRKILRDDLPETENQLP